MFRAQRALGELCDPMQRIQAFIVVLAPLMLKSLPNMLTSVMKVVVGLLFTACVLTGYTVNAATISATSCAAADVQIALNLARAGDTVVIPAGSSSWTQRVSWTA